MLGILGGGELSVSARNRTTEIVQLRARAMLPGLGPGQISDAKLAVGEPIRFVQTNALGAELGLTTLFCGAAFGVVGGFTCTYGIAELNRCSIDMAIAVLAQGLERVLRIPRHSSEGQ